MEKDYMNGINVNIIKVILLMVKKKVMVKCIGLMEEH